MLFPTLETERLHLVEIGQQHSQKYYEIMSLDEVTRYYGMENLKSIEEAAKMIDSFKNNFLSNRGTRWGIILKENQEFIGTVGLNNLSLPNKRAEIGYEIHPDYWRQGFTSEAVKEVLRYSFEELGLYRIGAVTYPENIASSSLLKKLGFKEEGLLRGYIYQKNRSHDAFIFSLLRTEWK
ncbi:GNAT family N-acetyltransferase [Thermaerobacillus caldiproteolyticus]|uniref:GNAT family N-acetyltransferase n=1 Tax=Thermaerobacillus caldiproteolyticus TaxID=247480 RepID=UPI00188BB812|nr:GNAT family N-acetyltransferase [Anoxybacillus caldiproteolyticus]QPA32491.1 GNAT family N-acetyltransferase [Anoxybacillus caldiproteolyticus]